MRTLIHFIITSIIFTVIKTDDLPKENPIIYVPLGDNAVFECAAFKLVKDKVAIVKNVHWRYFGRSKTIQHLGKESYSRFEINSSNFLTGYNIQRAHVGTYECVVTYKKFEDEQILRSAVDLEVQDCFEDPTSTQLSNRNPCQYGACIIEVNSITSYERLKCECVEQYSGIYCEDEVLGTWWREVIFYSPIIGHFIVAAIIIIGSSVIAKGTRKERISLIDDVPAMGPVDLHNPRRFLAKQIPTKDEVKKCQTNLSDLLQRIQISTSEIKNN